MSLKITVRATVIALKMQISFCQDHDKTKVNALNICKQNTVFILGEMSCFNQHNAV